jgi:hypothetical protein
MNSLTRAPANGVEEQLDLAALGQTWTPPQQLDATPEVSDVLAALPWWVSRGLLYLIEACANRCSLKSDR